MKRTTAIAEDAREAEEQVRINAFGPPPTNPVKYLREHSHLTMQQFADACGVTKQALIRLEQGTYSSLIPTVMEYLLENYATTELTLTNDYEEFQHLQRERHYRLFGDLTYSITNHPMRLARGKLNPTEVAKALCIPQATLVYFERNVKQQKSVPKLIVQVLREIGYTQLEVANFEKSYELYRQHKLIEAAPVGVGASA